MPVLQRASGPFWQADKAVKGSNEDSVMAVGQARMTRSRRGMRRSHDALRSNALSTDATSGEVHRRHHVTPDGFYRGKKVVESKDD